MRLAILVVYFLNDDSDTAILDIHHAFIRRYTADVAYTIYAAVNRLAEPVSRRVASVPGVKLCDIPTTPHRSSAEHGYYLDALAARAARDGATHLCTLDVDSFPVQAGWARRFAGELARGKALVAVHRAENGDTVLPHPSCIFFTSDFYRRYAPVFQPSPAFASPDEARAFSAFLRASRQTADTGIGFAYTLHRHDLAWERLERSNKANDHSVMAGIYGDAIFHLGGMARSDKLFRTDLGRPALRLQRLVGRLLGGMPKRLLKAVLPDLSARASRANHRTDERIRARLIADPDAYLAYLRDGK